MSCQNDSSRISTIIARNRALERERLGFAGIINACGDCESCPPDSNDPEDHVTQEELDAAIAAEAASRLAGDISETYNRTVADTALDARITDLENAESGVVTGIITLYRPGLPDLSYDVDAYTNSNRVAALANAINDATPGSKIKLVQGSYIMPKSLDQYGTHQDWKLEFEQGAWLNWVNESMAQNSWFAYEGDQRYAEDFGIFPDPTGLIDRQPRIQAALFSMSPDTATAQTITDYPGLKVRRGRLHLRLGQYPLSKPVYYTGFQHVLGVSGIQTVLLQMPGFAPSGHPRSEVFSLQLVLSLDSGLNPNPQFTFNAVVENIGFDNLDLVGNVKGSHLLAGGGQGCKIDGIVTNRHNKRGIVYHQNSAYFQVGRLWLNGLNDNLTGPLLHIAKCECFTIEPPSVNLINWKDPAGSGDTFDYGTVSPIAVTSNLMAVLIETCDKFYIKGCFGEAVSTLLVIHYSANFLVGPCGASQQDAGLYSGIGEDMVRISACSQYQVGPFTGMYFQRLWSVWNASNPVGLLTRCNAGNSPFARAAAITRGGSVGIVDGDLQNPQGLSSNSLTLQRAEPPSNTATGDTASAYSWVMVPGDVLANNSCYFLSLTKAGVTTSNPILMLPPGGTSVSAPAGYNLILNPDLVGGTHVGRYLNVGRPANPGGIAVDEVVVIKTRQPAVANAVAAVGAPTMVEFNNLVTQFNLLLSRFRATGGHGLIADT